MKYYAADRLAVQNFLIFAILDYQSARPPTGHGKRKHRSANCRLDVEKINTCRQSAIRTGKK
jgi:hypothetical protein